MIWSGLPVVIFGTGGTSKDVLHIIEEINNINRSDVFKILGFVDVNKLRVGEIITKGYKIVTHDNEFENYADKHKILGVVIPNGTPSVKKSIFQRIKSIKNIVFPNLIHPNVTFDKATVCFGVGNVITSGANLTHDISIGNFNLINNNCAIGHDSKIGDYNVINPCATISGNIIIGDECLIGTGANILQQLLLDNNVTVGAGAVVTKDVKEGSVVVGVPAGELIKQ